jgi:hypothetical protein
MSCRPVTVELLIPEVAIEFFDSLFFWPRWRYGVITGSTSLLGDSSWIGERGTSNDLPITKAKLLPTAR